MVTKSEIMSVRQKYPEHIPILVKTKDKTIELQNPKFLVKKDITVGQFLFSLRKRCIRGLNPTEAIHIFINDKLPPTSATLSTYYQNEKNDNDMLEVFICKENTFGKK
jgi:GABA(A) receptor-associated protein